MLKLITIAFETTGLDPAVDEILELAIQILDFREEKPGAASGVNVFRFAPSAAFADRVEQGDKNALAILQFHAESGLLADLKERGTHDVATVETWWKENVVPLVGPQDRPGLVLWSGRMSSFLDAPQWQFITRDLWQRWDFSTVAHISTANGAEPRKPAKSRAGDKVDVMREIFHVWQRIGVLGRVDPSEPSKAE